MIFGIIRDGVRSAFVRIVRYIVFAIIALLIFYIIGIFTNKKASALIYDGTDYSSYSNAGGGTVTGTKVVGSTNNGQIVFNFTGSKTTPVDSDLIGYRFNLFGIDWIGLQNQVCQGSNSNGSMAWSCTNPYDPPSSDKFDLYANIVLNNGTDGNVEYPCWLSNEFENTFVCTNDRSSSVIGINVYLKYYAPNTYSFQYRLEMTGLRFKLNNDTTPVVNSQQQTQQTITDSTTTTSQANATGSLNTISGQFNDVLNGWGGEWSSLTHVVLEPINTVLYAFDSGTTCTPITLTIPYLNDGQTITLPCMSSIYGTYFSGFITVFAMIIGGLYGYRTVMYILRTIKEVIDAENDKIEVIDL